MNQAWLESGEVLDVRLRIKEGVRLEGTVVDDQGRVVAGALVSAWNEERPGRASPPERETRSDDEGRFSFDNLGTSFSVVAESESMGCFSGLRGSVAPGSRLDSGLTLELRGKVDLHGRVLNAQDEPLEARVALYATGISSTEAATTHPDVERMFPVRAFTRSDASGAFDLGSVTMGPWQVQVDCPGYRTSYSRSPEQSGAWVLRPERGHGLRGSVLDDRGGPLEGARVVALSPEGSRSGTETGADGDFELWGLSPFEGGYLAVGAQGHAPRLVTGVQAGPGRVPFHQVRLGPGLSLAGRVLDEQGDPMSGVDLVLVGEQEHAAPTFRERSRSTLEHVLDNGRMRTASDGTFRFDDLYPGRFQVQVHPEGRSELHHDHGAYAGDEEVTIVVDERAMQRVVFTGRVIDRRTREPVSTYMVSVSAHSGGESSGTGRSIEDDLGEYRVAGLDPGRYSLMVDAPGYSRWGTAAATFDLGEHRQDVELSATRAVELLLVDGRGAPYEPAATGVLLREDGTRVWIEEGFTSTDIVRFIGGTAGVVNLPLEFMELQVHLRDGDPPAEFELDLERDASDEFEFRVDSAASRETFQVSSLVFSSKAEVDADAVRREFEEAGELFTREDCQPIPKSVRCSIKSASGATIFRATLKAGGAGYVLRTVQKGQSSEMELPAPALALGPVPGNAARLVLKAAGHETLELSLDPSAENGGVPGLLVMRVR